MAENKDKEGSSGSQEKIRWDDEMVDKLIDLYEVRPCLWDIADPTYSKRNVKEKALSEIKEQLGMEITPMKAKWNSFRAHNGSELAKENTTKSGQSADDLYESSWQYMEKMRFVEQVQKTAQSTPTLKLSKSSLSAEVSDTEIDLQDDSLNSSEPLVEKSSKRKRPSPNEQKNKLIAKCVDVLDRPKAQTLPTKETPDPFALYISEQLKSLDKRRRLLAEKRINDVLFELRFEEFGATGGIQYNQQFAPQPVQTMPNFQQQSPATAQQPRSYTSMLQDF